MKDVCKTKQTIVQVTQTEQELRERITNKVQELKDMHFRDLKESSNKMTLLKNEISLSLLDRDTIQFIKNIKREWNHLLSRSKTFDDKVNELQR